MMNTEDYEYRGLIAEAWDLLRGDTSEWEDRPFYRDIIRASGQPALDIGCGTGRLLLDYLADGIDIDGVDVSPEMLEVCRQKA
ncbi:MAG TPA: class I SAM-dependent methyltransferase, partial [Ktedonobacteraceae bacterium]|nr:class I SAM-dependent methyltransferase [Ktedonobacteraceae bacterium]